MNYVIGPTGQWGSFTFSHPSKFTGDQVDDLNNIPHVTEVLAVPRYDGGLAVSVMVSCESEFPDGNIKHAISAVNRVLGTTFILGRVTLTELNDEHALELPDGFLERLRENSGTPAASPPLTLWGWFRQQWRWWRASRM